MSNAETSDNSANEKKITRNDKFSFFMFELLETLESCFPESKTMLRDDSRQQITVKTGKKVKYL